MFNKITASFYKMLLLAMSGLYVLIIHNTLDDLKYTFSYGTSWKLFFVTFTVLILFAVGGYCIFAAANIKYINIR